MPTLEQIHKKTKVPMRWLSILHRDGFLRGTNKTGDLAYSIVAEAKRRKRMTLVQMMQFVKHPELMDELGDDQQIIARHYIDALGSYSSEVCPWSVSAAIPLAASKDRDAITTLARWLKKHIERESGYEKPCSYHYVAIRLLGAVPDNLLEQYCNVMSKALFYVRQHEAMHGYSFVDEYQRTQYQKKAKKSEMLFDL